MQREPPPSTGVIYPWESRDAKNRTLCHLISLLPSLFPKDCSIVFQSNHPNNAKITHEPSILLNAQCTSCSQHPKNSTLNSLYFIWGTGGMNLMRSHFHSFWDLPSERHAPYLHMKRQTNMQTNKSQICDHRWVDGWRTQIC